MKIFKISMVTVVTAVLSLVVGMILFPSVTDAQVFASVMGLAFGVQLSNKLAAPKAEPVKKGGE